MDFSIQESAEVIVAVIVFSLLMQFMIIQFSTIQTLVSTIISSWCCYGL